MTCAQRMTEEIITNIDVVIRQMCDNDVLEAQDLILACFDGRRTLLKTFLAVDRKGFFVAIDPKNDQVIGVCSGPFIRPDMAFIGNFVVRQEFRGRGIGQRLFKCVMDYIGDRNCCLMCWPQKYTLYKGLGFVMEVKPKFIHYSGHYRPSKEMDISDDQKSDGIEIKQILNEDLIMKVIEYDQHIQGYKREQLLRLWLKEPDCQSLVALEGCVVVGYGCLRADTDISFRTRPVYANTSTIARRLIASLIQLALKIANDSLIAIPVLSTNELAVKIAEDLGFKPTDELTLLFRNSIIECNYSRVYAIMSEEFSI